MKNYFSSDFKLGILGGGQLGKMLLYETRKYDIATSVVDPNPEAPAKLAANQFQIGDLQDYETVLQFGRKVDVLTFEIESVNLEALQQLEKEGKKVYPSAETLLKIQDKGIQKQFYAEHQLPTANFRLFTSKAELTEAIIRKEVDFPFVWKACKGGYDGKGVSVIKKQEDLIPLPETACMREDLIPFKNELAVIVARNVSGEIKTYPVVEMEFHPTANQVEYVLSPARISAEVEQKARKVAMRVSEAFQHVGLLAVELFQTENDEILINEVAPRPHNSGHFSIEASYTNQFEQHLRAILDLPLGETQQKLAAVMVNLVGDADHTGNVHYQNIEEIMQMPGVTPHIYGKRETRPFRKMGHVSIVHQDINEARKIAEQVKKKIKVISKK
ncbi:5-(carboxyamino)imidazole ribonucleotide synthase [Psychroflexus planctonicus]|uniref:N5-carboxyaminoimidazole ribonucleotide synthase n=1 Tax=Psychroflexus planctonicus TaxID=1526575 RepID=A0ABQ1SLI6_9FLAO|nr:5-(carboxyamino)imidazole ribonucleotide synthase [Psychroflexus planctonicus]GGE42089.1 N5-carboxyaminoimidazole ribonucleotide synthase [Psychroflexus planctonicus]